MSTAKIVGLGDAADGDGTRPRPACYFRVGPPVAVADPGLALGRIVAPARTRLNVLAAPPAGQAVETGDLLVELA